MENTQFEVEGDRFNCVQCNSIVKISAVCCKALSDNPEEEIREVPCPKCGTMYLVGINPDGEGYVVTEKTGSASELEEIDEKEYEDDSA